MNQEKTEFKFSELDEDSQLAYALANMGFRKFLQENTQEEIQTSKKIAAYLHKIPEDSPMTENIASFYHGYIEGLSYGMRKGLKLGMQEHEEKEEEGEIE